MLDLGYWSPLPESELLGSQKALVLGPSLGMTHKSWQRAVSFIKEDIKPIVFDLPGHGLSTMGTHNWTIRDLAEAVIRLVDRLEIRSFTFAGSSISGLVGYQLAIRHEKRVNAIVTICSSARLDNQGYWKGMGERVVKEGTKKLAKRVVSDGFSQGFCESAPDVLDQLIDDFYSVDESSYIQGCTAISNADYWSELSGIRVPTLIVHGSEDQIVTLSDSQRANSLIADSGLVEITGVGHQAIVEAPEVAMKHVSFYARKFR